MDKLTAIKIKYQDGTYSDQVPISALAQNINWDENSNIVDILGNVDLSKGDIQTQINSKIPLTQKGVANGIATLDSSGFVPSTQLPSYVDDILEYASYNSLPSVGETGKIYVTLDTNLTYRWSGASYIEISKSLALGETSSTAYRGDRGKTSYDHATDINRLRTAKSVGLYKVAATAEGHVADLVSVTKLDITNLGIPTSDTNVTQTSSSTNAPYEVLFSGTADDTTRTEGARKSSGLTFNPSTKNLAVTNLTVAKINGINVGSSPKFTDEDHITTATTNGSGNAVTSVSANNGALAIIKGATFVTNLDGISGSSINRFGVCSTNSDVAEKTANITSGTFSLIMGAQVAIKFNNSNTANNPTLNINNTGAKNIFYNGEQITDGSEKQSIKGVAIFIYDGTQWHLI